MRPNAIWTAVGVPFLVTLVGVGPVTLLGSCDDVTECGAKGFVVGPLILIAVLITGFVVGRLSPSLVGLLGVLAAAGLVVGFTMVAGLWYQAPDPEGESSGPATWVLLTGLVVLLTLPGFVIGRSMNRGALIAKLDAQRAAGSISPDEYARQMTLQGWEVFHDQAPPDHRCGRCGKPLSPVWHGKCQHCGASYVEFPPVPRTQQPG